MENGVWHVALDGKPMRVPGGAVLRVQHERLALAMAEEWQAAPAEMSFEDVPLTRLAGTLEERVAVDPQPVIDSLAAYAQSDLLCYRADQPPALVQRQAQVWQPWLDWAARRYDAKLLVTSGIIYVTQPPASLALLRAAVAAQSAAVLTALGVAVPAMGSLVLGLALAEGEIDAVHAYEASVLDELFQAEFWGDDTEAVARRRRVAADIALAERFIRVCS